jgi:DnaJ-domain-containing protein 1
MGVFLYIIVVIIWIISAIYGKSNSNYSNNYEEVPYRFILPNRFSNYALLETYLLLAVLLIRIDREKAGPKIIYIKKYFLKHYKKDYFDISEAVSRFYRIDIYSLEEIAEWLNKHQKENEIKSQLIYFLMGLCVLDGSINDKEYKFIKNFNQLLNLSEEELERIYATYNYTHQQQQQEYYQQSNQNQTNNQQRTSNYQSSQLENALKILGLKIGASEDEIKSAYRNLAKLNHPDRFMNEDEAHQKIAHERFVKIQEAYEFALKNT